MGMLLTSPGANRALLERRVSHLGFCVRAKFFAVLSSVKELITSNYRRKIRHKYKGRETISLLGSYHKNSSVYWPCHLSPVIS